MRIITVWYRFGYTTSKSHEKVTKKSCKSDKKIFYKCHTFEPTHPSLPPPWKINRRITSIRISVFMGLGVFFFAPSLSYRCIRNRGTRDTFRGYVFSSTGRRSPPPHHVFQYFHFEWNAYEKSTKKSTIVLLIARIL